MEAGLEELVSTAEHSARGVRGVSLDEIYTLLGLLREYHTTITQEGRELAR